MLVLNLSNNPFISTKFKNYPQYEVVDIVSNHTYNNPEDYEANFNKKDYKFLKKYNKPENEIFVIVSAQDFFSAIILKLLELIKKSKITILFLKDDLTKARKKNKLHQRAMFGVLQEYARSGLFEEMILVDIPKIKNILNDVSIMDFVEKSAKFIVSSFHMMNILKNQKPVYGNFLDKEDYERISTFGIMKLDSPADEETLFNLNNISSKSYLFCLPEDKIREDITLLDKIDYIVNENIESTVISYTVYPSKFKDDYIYVISRTGNIQENNN